MFKVVQDCRVAILTNLNLHKDPKFHTNFQLNKVKYIQL